MQLFRFNLACRVLGQPNSLTLAKNDYLISAMCSLCNHLVYFDKICISENCMIHAIRILKKFEMIQLLSRNKRHLFNVQRIYVFYVTNLLVYVLISMVRADSR